MNRLIGQATHTCVEMLVSKVAYDEIAAKLRAAGYDHVFNEGAMDMSGIAISCEPDTSADSEGPPRRRIDFAWLIEVVWTGGESRSPLYFSGEIQPGRYGRVTHDPLKAERFEEERGALHVLQYLRRREMGVWRVVQHAFGQ